MYPDFIYSAYHQDILSFMSADPLDVLSKDVVESLEGISDSEKVRLSKRWDEDKDHETHDPSAPDYTAIYERFNPRFHARSIV